MKREYSKQVRKKLRKLAGIAHERELARALAKLDEQFNEWRDNKINAFELNDRIHSFHQHSSRDIWKLYTNAGQYDLLVARALQTGVLTDDEVGQELFNLLAPIIQGLQENGF